MMYDPCPRCGFQVKRGKRVCPTCGWGRRVARLTVVPSPCSPGEAAIMAWEKSAVERAERYAKQAANHRFRAMECDARAREG